VKCGAQPLSFPSFTLGPPVSRSNVSKSMLLIRQVKKEAVTTSKGRIDHMLQSAILSFQTRSPDLSSATPLMGELLSILNVTLKVPFGSAIDSCSTHLKFRTSTKRNSAPGYILWPLMNEASKFPIPLLLARNSWCLRRRGDRLKRIYTCRFQLLLYIVPTSTRWVGVFETRETFGHKALSDYPHEVNANLCTNVRKPLRKYEPLIARVRSTTKLSVEH
jgi:hypothetical protein